MGVTGIGYGQNKPVKVHDGVSGAKFSAVNQLGKKVDVECNAESCDFNDIIQAHSNMVFTIEGDSNVGTVEAQATLTVKNTASNQVTFMDASCQKDTATTLDAGKDLTLPIAPGAHKFWVVPKGCTKEVGCYPCGLDCLGCFYIAPTVTPQGVMVTGIGYGQNKPVKVHDGVSGAKFSAVNQLGKEVNVECNTQSCDFNDIIQAHSAMVFT